MSPINSKIEDPIRSDKISCLDLTETSMHRIFGQIDGSHRRRDIPGGASSIPSPQQAQIGSSIDQGITPIEPGATPDIDIIAIGRSPIRGRTPIIAAAKSIIRMSRRIGAAIITSRPSIIGSPSA